MSFFCSRIQSKIQYWIQQAFLLIHHRHPGTWGKPIFYSGHPLLWASLVAQMVKSLPTMWETPVQSLGQEKEMATHSNILAWKIPWTEEPGGLQFMGHKESVMPSNHLSHPLSSPSPPALNLSQHQGLFKWVSSSHQVAKVLEFQLQHQFFQWTLRTDPP